MALVNVASLMPSFRSSELVNSAMLTGSPLRHECSDASARIDTRRQSDGWTSGVTPFSVWDTKQIIHIPLSCWLNPWSGQAQRHKRHGIVVWMMVWYSLSGHLKVKWVVSLWRWKLTTSIPDFICGDALIVRNCLSERSKDFNTLIVTITCVTTKLNVTQDTAGKLQRDKNYKTYTSQKVWLRLTCISIIHFSNFFVKTVCDSVDIFWLKSSVKSANIFKK